MKKASFFLAVLAAMIVGLQASMASTLSQAYDTAKVGIDESQREKVISVYGTGTPTEVQKWVFIFYDSSVETHARAVTVEGNRIAKVAVAASPKPYPSEVAFNPTPSSLWKGGVVDEAAALQAAAQYAKQKDIFYTNTHVLLRRPGTGRSPQWRVQLRNEDRSKGYVYVDAQTGKIARFEPGVKPSGNNNGGGGFFKDVENTFLGVGGDLEEFFTGDRTVDQ